MAKITPTTTGPVSLPQLRRPRGRSLYSLMKPPANRRAPPGHQEQHQKPGHRDRFPGGDVTDEVADQGGDDHHGAAHGRRAPLVGVPGRPFLADGLPVPVPGEHPDGDGRAEQGHRHGHRGGDQKGLHWAVSFSLAERPAGWDSRSAATVSSPAAREALTSTTSPGASRARNAATAAGIVGTAMASPGQPEVASAPSRMGSASFPTTIRPVTPVPAACAPASRWLSRASSPSSAMWPSTANDRRPRAMWPSASSAARSDSGLAL